MPRIVKVVSAAIATALAAVIAAAGAGAGGPAGTTHLAIQHVQQGCHVWSRDDVQSTSLRLKVAAGARLHIVNGDILAHRLVQVAGPRLTLRGHMMPGKREVIAFRRPGVYRFEDRVIEMGGTTKLKAVGPDNTLRLNVSVG